MKFQPLLYALALLLFTWSTSRTLGSQSALVREVGSGQVIKPWLILGPIYEDVSAQEKGLSLHRAGRTEREDARSGHATVEAVVAEAERLTLVHPREGLRESLRGETATWRLSRDASPHIMWGRHFETNHLSVAAFFTQLTPTRVGKNSLRLTTKIDNSEFDGWVSVNGKVVCDTRRLAPKIAGAAKQYVFEADLQSGSNAVLVCIYKIDITPQAGFQLETLDGAVRAEVPLNENLTRAARVALEEDVESVELERELVKPGQVLRLRRQMPRSPALARVRLERMPEPTRQYAEVATEKIREVMLKGETSVDICRADELADGRYRLWCFWQDARGDPITSVDWEIFKITPTPNKAAATLNDRKESILENYAAMSPLDGIYLDIWRHVARYQRGERIPSDAIEAACDYVDRGADGTDFVMLALLRLLTAEEKRPRLEPEARERMKQSVLRFRYWADEPADPDAVRNVSSENHRLQWHVAEFIAGQLYPTELFPNSQQRGLFHAQRARGFLTEWISERARFGFDEWHSDIYFCINFAGLATLRDQIVPEDFKFRQRVDSLLEMLATYVATGSYEGYFSAPHRRTSGYDLRFPALQQISPLSWLFFGRGQLLNWEGTRSPAGLVAVVSVAASGFDLPGVIANIAADRSEVADQRFRQGNWPTGALRQGNLGVYRTPDYLLSCLQDGGRGSTYDQMSVGQVTFKNDAVLTWSCPHTNTEGTRPDYWGGNVTLPRGVQFRNVMALTWRLAPFTWMTHCFLEPARFDEVREKNGWVFVRSGDGYAGIYSENGFRRDVPGPFRGRELVCFATENTWLVECGRRADWESFDRFVEKVSAANVKREGRMLRYESPSIGTFVTGWEGTPTVQGKPIPLRDYPLAESPWVSSPYGSGHMQLRYGDEQRDLWIP